MWSAPLKIIALSLDFFPTATVVKETEWETEPKKKRFEDKDPEDQDQADDDELDELQIQWILINEELIKN